LLDSLVRVARRVGRGSFKAPASRAHSSGEPQARAAEEREGDKGGGERATEREGRRARHHEGAGQNLPPTRPPPRFPPLRAPPRPRERARGAKAPWRACTWKPQSSGRHPARAGVTLPPREEGPSYFYRPAGFQPPSRPQPPRGREGERKTDAGSPPEKRAPASAGGSNPGGQRREEGREAEKSGLTRA